ncbi:ribosomal protein S18 [Lojkania enalia]|uniref:Small ribosomal subunit protein bS18m n=1 Tax=Lojkania enalia TaxID=147567 RepID=A0A9P4N9L2_9PLEO|nr:ribosomal protein S18 [Didymosphaeria enalia]
MNRSANQRHPTNNAPKKSASSKLSAFKFAQKNLPKSQGSMAQEIAEHDKRRAYQNQIHRTYKAGDVYSPRDLTGVEQKKWKLGRKTAQSDAFDTLGINPINEYKNFTMMSEFMTEMGRIRHSRDSGLRPVNQRKIAKAIRRAIGLGLMPSVHKHPLVLKKKPNV